MHNIELENISIKYSDHTIIDDISMGFLKSKVTTIVGANGCGKSSILKSIARLIKLDSGSISLNGYNIAQTPTKSIAKNLAILPQSAEAPSGVTVEMLVKQGRYPYKSMGKPLGKEDCRIVEDALELTNMTDFRSRDMQALSGGQKQRAWIALTLAQDTDILLLDEPTTYLDMEHQYEVLELLKMLNERQNKTIIMVLHDINLASRYSDSIIGIKNRKIYKSGCPNDVINDSFLKSVFNVESQIIKDPVSATPYCITYSHIR